MEGRAATVSELRSWPSWLLGLIPLLLIVAAIGAFALLDGPGLGERRGPPVEELAVERTTLTPGVIELTVRNDGPDAVTIAQAVVNDAFVQFSGAELPIGRLETATVRVQQPWVEGEAYEVVLLTSSGGTIAHEIPVAVATPSADASFFGLLALLGVYVGVIPVALGMLWLPWVRRVPPSWLRALPSGRNSSPSKPTGSTCSCAPSAASTCSSSGSSGVTTLGSATSLSSSTLSPGAPPRPAENRNGCETAGSSSRIDGSASASRSRAASGALVKRA